MKIFFNLKPPNGSYGGGAFFVKDLMEYFIEKKYKITFKLENDIDYIIMIDPRKGKLKKYGLDEIVNYKQNVNKNVKIIYPVNECDSKRLKSINIEPKILKAITQIDIPIFISHWLYDYYHSKYNLNSKK